MRWLLFSFVCSSLCFANPEGGVATSGAANIVNASKHTLHIHAKDQSIIQWNSFSIEAHELTKFIQPSKYALVLNKVVGNEISSLLGTLEANGQVLLINPNGIIFGENALIETGGFIASTLDLQSNDLSGDLLFQGEGTGSIVNFGTIKAWDGDVTLLSRSIENHGHIEAREGHVNMGAGQEVLLQKEGEQRIYIRAHSFEEETGIENLGTISAIQTELRADGNPYTYAIKHEGTIDALTLQEENGRVFLVAEEGVTLCNGKILAPGGTVHILGDRVGALEKAYVDVSLPTGGGTIYVGGAKQGEDKAIYNANFTTALEGGTFLANATENGKGGTIIFWADGATRCASHNEAKGGPLGGDGGFIEISGKKYFSFEGAFNDTTAPMGEVGTLLLDPDAQITFDGSSTTKNFNPAPLFAPTITAEDNLILGIGAIMNALTTSNVVIETDKPSSRLSGGITYSDRLEQTYCSPYKLTLKTGGENGILWQGSLTNIGSGDIELISTNGGVTFLASATPAHLQSEGNITIGTSISPIKGTVSLSSQHQHPVEIISDKGALHISAQKDFIMKSSDGKAHLVSDKSLSIQTGENITLKGSALYPLTLTSAAVSLDANQALKIDTHVSIDATSNLLMLTAGGDISVKGRSRSPTIQAPSMHAISSSGSIFLQDSTRLNVMSGECRLTSGKDIFIDNQVAIHQKGDRGLKLTAIGTVAGQDGNITLADQVVLKSSSKDGIVIRAGSSVNLADASLVQSKAKNGVLIVTDTLSPNSIGPGGFKISEQSKIDSHGNPLAIYTSTREHNAITPSGNSLNNSPYLPQIPFLNTEQEKWGVFDVSQLAVYPYTIFHKESGLINIAPGVNVSQTVFSQIAVSFIGPFTAELFRTLNPYNEYISGAIEFTTSETQDPEEKDTLFIRRPSFRHVTTPTMPEKGETNLSF